MERVLVIGCGGSGKTTFARRLAERSGLPLIHLDRLHWRPGWRATPQEAWRATVKEIVARERWIIEGHYGGTLDLRLPACDTVVFLDGGRVWTNDERFGLQGDPNGQEHLFVATGAGLTVRTPVGPIEVSAGYKLNPSLTDLVDSEDLVTASRQGIPFDELPRHNSRRWQLHLAIGTSY